MNDSKSSRPSSTCSSACRGYNTRSRKLGCMVELVALRKTNEVAAYVRASMDRKGDRWTVDMQLRKIRALAEIGRASCRERVSVSAGSVEEREKRKDCKSRRMDIEES